MPRWGVVRDEDWYDEGEGWDDPDGDDDTVPCPYCRREIHEDSIQCPYCKTFISSLDAPAERKPLWFVVGLFACLFVIYRWIFWH